jgi:hypothetical protein
LQPDLFNKLTWNEPGNILKMEDQVNKTMAMPPISWI